MNNEILYKNEQLENKQNSNKIKRAMGIACLGLMVIGAGTVVEWAVDGYKYITKPIQYSESTHIEYAEPGDGLNNIAAHVKGISEVDTREVAYDIETNPKNEKVLKDGLQPGDPIEIPDSVKP